MNKESKVLILWGLLNVFTILAILITQYQFTQTWMQTGPGQYVSTGEPFPNWFYQLQMAFFIMCFNMAIWLIVDNSRNPSANSSHASSEAKPSEGMPRQARMGLDEGQQGGNTDV